MRENSTVSCYNSHSSDYDIYQSTVVPHYLEMLDIVAMTCSRYLGQNESSPRIVDLGCGTGNASIAILKKIPTKIFLIDGSSKMVNIALDKISSKFPGAVTGNRVADISGSNWDEDLRSEEYNAIVSTLVLEHLTFDRYRAVLDKCFRLLAPGGWLIAVEGYEEEGSDMIEWFNSQASQRMSNLDPRMSGFVSQLRAQKEVHYYTSKRQKEEWWSTAGFESVNVLWQYLCIALMVGRKPIIDER
jgi:ubiquinone/menaquinone biosynthesis C-methylase UbiE